LVFDVDLKTDIIIGYFVLVFYDVLQISGRYFFCTGIFEICLLFLFFRTGCLSYFTVISVCIKFIINELISSFVVILIDIIIVIMFFMLLL
jgi:hypothetical protein